MKKSFDKLEVSAYKCKKERSVTFKICKNAFLPGAAPQVPHGELTTLPQMPYLAVEGTPRPIPTLGAQFGVGIVPIKYAPKYFCQELPCLQ